MNKQQGFTLIELVMVIVILGILAATALPRFANLQGDARIASINGAAGAVRSAMAIVHAQSIINGTEATANTTVSLEGQDVAIAFGYPTIASIDFAAGLGANDYTNAGGEISFNPARANCNVTYVAATSASTAATATVNDGGC